MSNKQCPGHDANTDCEIDPLSPCKACNDAEDARQARNNRMSQQFREDIQRDIEANMDLEPLTDQVRGEQEL